MSAPWNEWDWDYFWHLLGGIGMNAAVIGALVLSAYLANAGVPFSFAWWIPFVMLIPVFAFGIIREFKQHSRDRLTAHQWLEGVLWGAGALLAAIVGLVFLL